MVVPGGVLMIPNAIANFSLCPHSKYSFSSSSMLCRTHEVSGVYPSFLILSHKPSRKVWIWSL
ncbi:hypothetical protein ACHQM5_001531 [Ranunculus cassubicifolius]